MASVQPDLHKYFKTAKNYSHSKKKVGFEAKHEVNVEPGERLHIMNREKDFVHSVGENADVNGSDLKSAETPSSSTKDVLNGYVAPTNTPVLSFSPIVNHTPENKSTSTVVREQRKRKRTQREENEAVLRTPTGNEHKTRVEEDGVSFTVKKRLLMDEEKPSSPKKLRAEDIKKKLGKCGHLDELRTKLLKLNECEAKIRKFKTRSLSRTDVSSNKNLLLKSPKKSSAVKITVTPKKCIPPSPYKLKSVHPQLEHFKALEFEVISPVKSPSKVPTPSKVSCSEQFAHLASPSSELVLPHRYSLLKEVFRAVDTIVSLLHNRQEITTYSKLKPAVQQMIRTTFCERHLGQIKTVFPLAYFFKQERLRNRKAENFNSTHYQLTVAPNMAYKEGSARNLLDAFDQPQDSQSFRKMDSVVMVERRQIFHNSLLRILQESHRTYLQSLDPPVVVDGPILRWHPEFPLDDIEPPEPSPLPQPPVEDKVDNAKEVLEKARGVFAVNNRMMAALEKVASEGKARQKSTTEVKTQNRQIATALKAVSLSLLEKIRAREAQKAAQKMTRPSHENKEIQMLSRLPEMARIIRNLFITERKAAIPIDIVNLKVSRSHTSMLSQMEVDDHLKLMMKHLPDWCSLHQVRSGHFLKINKLSDLNDIVNKLEKIVKDKSDSVPAAL